MAPKRPLGNPPPASSCSSTISSSEDSSSSEEEIVEKQEEEEEEEKEEESDFKIKSILKKRPAETPKSTETSKKRRKGPIQRVWGDKDVIAMLEGMIQFKEEIGADPSTEMADFYDYIKDAIHITVSKNQMSDKIRSLRNKYQNNAKKGKDGEDPVFSNPHQYQTFHVSKLVWGAVDTNKSKTCATASKPEKSLEELLAAKVRADADEFWTTYPSLHKSMELMPLEQRSSMKDTMGLVRRSKVKELDDKWHKFNSKEFGLYMEKTQLVLDVLRAIGFGQGN